MATTTVPPTTDFRGRRNGVEKSYRGICSAMADYFPRLTTFANADLASLRRYQDEYQLPSGASFHVTLNQAAIGKGKTSPILTISGKGQQAIDLLFSASETPALTKVLLELNDKTKAYIEALR